MPERPLPHSIEGASSIDWGSEDPSREQEKVPDTEKAPPPVSLPRMHEGTVTIDVTPKEYAEDPMEFVPEPTTGETFDEIHERGQKRKELAQMASRVQALSEQSRPSDQLDDEDEEPAPPTVPSSGVRRVMDRLLGRRHDPAPESAEEAPTIRVVAVEPPSGIPKTPSTPDTAPNVPSVRERDDDEQAA